MSAPRVARWKPLATILGVLALVEALSVALLFVAEAERVEGRGSAYAEIVEEYRKDPAGFGRWSARMLAESASRTSMADMKAGPQAAVAELGPALRVVTTLRGPVESHDGVRREVELEYREYYHAAGLDLVHTECDVAGPACDARNHLVAETERRLLSRLDAAEAAPLLIDSGQCSEVGDADYERLQTHTCVYPLAIQMTVRRYPEGANRERLHLLRAREP